MSPIRAPPSLLRRAGAGNNCNKFRCRKWPRFQIAAEDDPTDWMGAAKSTPAAAPPAEEPAAVNISVPAAFCCVGVGLGAAGFGAGYGSRAYASSAAFKELVEKFPEPPSPEAERLARHGASRAFLAGTAVAGAMGVGAILALRLSGIKSVEDFGEECKRWLPSKQHLETTVGPQVDGLQRKVSENLQTVRDVASATFQESGVGRRAASAARGKEPDKQPEAWEAELISKLEAQAEEGEGEKAKVQSATSRVGRLVSRATTSSPPS